jgi:hypothetical protein
MLRSNLSRSIAVMVPDITDPYYIQINGDLGRVVQSRVLAQIRLNLPTPAKMIGGAWFLVWLART